MDSRTTTAEEVTGIPFSSWGAETDGVALQNTCTIDNHFIKSNTHAYTAMADGAQPY